MPQDAIVNTSELADPFYQVFTDAAQLAASGYNFYNGIKQAVNARHALQSEYIQPVDYNVSVADGSVSMQPQGNPDRNWLGLALFVAGGLLLINFLEK